MRVTGIFTGSSISPGVLSRQCSNHYTFRAGQNRYSYGRRLLGLEFKALACAEPLLLTFQHRAGVSPYTSPFGFAETCVFAKQLLEPLLCDHFSWLPFSLSYGVILPSSLTTLLPSACGFSPHLPVSVCGTGMYDAIAAFLGSVDSMTSLLSFSPRHTSTSISGFAY